MLKKISLITLIVLTGCTSNNVEESDIDSQKNDEVVNEVYKQNKNEALDLSEVHNDQFKLFMIDGNEVKESDAYLSFSTSDYFGEIIKGNGACNNFFAKYSIDRSVLISGQVAATNNTNCFDYQKLYENIIFSILGKNPSMVIQGNEITLKTKSREIKFKK